jgi:FkbM family methyltransferase
MKIVLDQRDFSLTPHLAMDGFWESWITVWAMRQVTPQTRLLNIGANCGYYAALFAHCGAAAVVAVEAQEGLAENIRLTAALNGLGDRLRVEHCVAGSEHRMVKLKEYDDFFGSGHVDDAPVVDGGLAARLVDVQEKPAHELMPGATAVFVDAEGYEPLIWEGLRPLLDTRQLDWIALEWAPVRYANPEKFLLDLRSYGRLTLVGDQGQEIPTTDEQLLRGSELDTLVVRRGQR